ncbi:MAG TPA: hypothetical protein VEM60_00790, partial [Candidatus Dormibacteraeota bacterium]|nr:hypothetical protein [Candidatus Dormibacteraeota bacterium]
MRVNRYFSMLEQVRISINLDHLPFATGVPISHELLHAMEKYAILAEGHNSTKQIAAVLAAKRGGRDIGEPIIKLEAAMKLRCDGGVDEYGPMKYALRLPMGTRQFYQRPPNSDVTKEQESTRRWNKSSRWSKRIETARKFSGGTKMREKKLKRLDILLLLFFAGLRCWPASVVAQVHPQDTEWPSYAADLAGTRYRPLDQINAANFSDLEIAWRIKTDNFGDRPEYKLEGTPLMVNGV